MHTAVSSCEQRKSSTVSALPELSEQSRSCGSNLCFAAVTATSRLPPEESPPYPCALLLHDWSGSQVSRYQDFNDISGGNISKSLLQDSFATVCPDTQCHGNRIAINDFAPVDHYADVEQPVGHAKQVFALIPSKKKELQFHGGNHKLTPGFVPHPVDWIETHLSRSCGRCDLKTIFRTLSPFAQKNGQPQVGGCPSNQIVLTSSLVNGGAVRLREEAR